MAAVLQHGSNLDVMTKLAEVYCDLFNHEGFGDIRVEMRILRRGQKEVIIHCGKQYRFVVDYAGEPLKALEVAPHGPRYIGPDRRRSERDE